MDRVSGQPWRLGARPARWQAWRHGEPVHLTDMEYRVLDYMLDRRGDLVTRRAARARLGLSPQSQTRVDVLMSKLRRHMESERGPRSW